jgi:hypothetical protein
MRRLIPLLFAFALLGRAMTADGEFRTGAALPPELARIAGAAAPEATACLEAAIAEFNAKRQALREG